MRYISLLLICMLCVALGKAQDTLYKKDGSKVAVHILETGYNLVKYTRIEDTSGTVYHISRDFVSKIVTGTGETVLFPETEKEPDPMYTYRLRNKLMPKGRKNMLSVDMADLILGMITVAYDRTLTRGLFSLRIPLSTGKSLFDSKHSIDPFSDYYIRSETIFGTGAGLFYYPMGHRVLSVYTGPLLQYRWFRDYYEVFDPYSYVASYKYKTARYAAFFFQGGALFQPIPPLNIGADLGIGLANVSGTQYDDNTFGNVKLSFYLGFRF